MIDIRPDTLNAFISKIMAINDTTPGMGGASAGVRGFSGMGEQTVNDLKRSVIQFASLYRIDDADIGVLTEYAHEIEGYIRNLQVMAVIPSDRSDILIADLGKLIDSHQRSTI